MGVNVIVSYDGTANDDDGLALARMLAGSGSSISLAYVRHSREYDHRREEIAEHDAERRLELGAVWLKDPKVPRHIVLNPSTGAGLAELAESEGAALVVFGSDYRTSPGRVEPGGAAQQMLSGGSVAVAVAVAGLRTSSSTTISTISALSAEGDDAPQQTATALAQATGATLATDGDRTADLIVVGSQPAAQAGRIALSGPTRAQLDSARSSVLVVPRATPIAF